MSPPVAQQIITSMRIIMGLDGTDEGTIVLGVLRITLHVTSMAMIWVFQV